MRLVVRREFLEIYVDERYVQSHVAGDGFDVTRLGFFNELGQGVFRLPTVWGMQ